MPRPIRSKLSAIPAIERATHAVSLFLGTRPDLNVSQAEAHVLAFLHIHGPSRINEIHDAFGHRRSTLTSVLDRLEKRRLLKRSVDPSNRRSVVVSLSGSGTNLARRVYETLESLEREALTAMSAGDLLAVDRVAEALTNHAIKAAKLGITLRTRGA
jgi:DNA-binding MarR family transcriptional regulator